MLGDAPPLDRVDAVLVEAAQRRAGFRVGRARSAPTEATFRFGVCLDERAHLVHRETGAVDLSARPLLFRILQVVADHGGEADKETLVRLAWQEPDYHPLRHDGRVHTAVRALRRILEADPAEPRLLVTTSAGYALAPGEPVRRVITATAPPPRC
jgi:DNA-binding response OmpR family regulator